MRNDILESKDNILKWIAEKQIEIIYMQKVKMQVGNIKSLS